MSGPVIDVPYTCLGDPPGVSGWYSHCLSFIRVDCPRCGRPEVETSVRPESIREDGVVHDRTMRCPECGLSGPMRLLGVREFIEANRSDLECG